MEEPRVPVLIVYTPPGLYGKAQVEVYGQVRVHVAERLYTTPRNERLAEKYLLRRLPLAYRRLFLSGTPSEIHTFDWRTPADEVERLTKLALVRESLT